ncbi:MAG: 23S rRNA (adenine(2503)-C(2))-methyltransferase RlmN [Defluviitaleaceae bacterium]|nr:23S rRNA (adenine(2503)-C(2))-methyltransferase RlmN [Defluviitaleaceae bacterium]
MIDVLSMTLGEMEDFVVSLGEKRFRGRQLFAWLHRRMVTSFGDCSDMPAAFREKLAACAYISYPRVVRQISDGQRAKKYLLEFEKDIIIESVLMNADYGATLCVSTQVGCRMGCAFCASAIGGLCRNLRAGEIVAQVYHATRDNGAPVSNIVLMGCGEPFDNYDNVVKFLEIINSKDGAGIGQRHITISTCGVVPRIVDFARFGAGYGLAVSLHAPNDELRRVLMPIAKAYPLPELMDACDVYTALTRRRITYEYALIDGCNDSDECAEALGKLLKGRLAHVNLMLLNRVQERDLVPSPRARVASFMSVLAKYRVQTTLRKSHGGDINAACGQLRAENRR